MTAELGGLTGIVAPDDETVRFLRERRGVDFAIEPWMHSDPGRHYAETIHVDCSGLSPHGGRARRPRQRHAARLSSAAPVKVDIAYGGSCTAGKREDFDHYHEVLAWGLAHGLRVAQDVCAVPAVRHDGRARLLHRPRLRQDLRTPSARASCSRPAAPAPTAGPGSSTDAAQVTVSAINRNFPGRSGPGQVWLASPPTVVASALAGELISFAALQLEYERTS